MRFLNDRTMQDYLSDAQEVAEATPKSFPDLIALLIDIDQFWRADVLGVDIDINPLAGTMLVQSHFLWLATTRVALSGHAIATYPLLRSALEAACYAFMIQRDEQFAQYWLHRDRPGSDAKKTRRKLGDAVADTVTALRNRDGTLASLLRDTYDSSITFGAHPNSKSVLHHLSIEDHDQDQLAFELDCINSASSPNTERAILATVELGIVVSWLNALTPPSHPSNATVYATLQALSDRKNALYPLPTP